LAPVPAGLHLPAPAHDPVQPCR